MDINELITIVKNKLLNQIKIESINIEDKSFLHKNHKGNQEGKYHLKLIIVSQELKKMNKIESNKKIYKILDLELKEFIHSIQILIS
ncbi:BolA family protein [Candidatus Pelagibacter sp.]|uniref:BolA family protein n=1 Tax=Candidatus Pelagibacter sp. TaxID=2024849 RepID=UPI003F855C2A